MIHVNENGGFIDGNGSTVRGTIVTAKYLNDVYAELANIWKAAGIETADQNDQAAKAIQHLIDTAINEVSKNVRTYQPGDFVATFAKAPPKGTLVCNGGAISRVDYANLFDSVGVQYGSGDGSTTFNLPNIPENLALLAAGANLDAIGQIISGDIKSHAHSGSTGLAGGHNHTYNGPAEKYVTAGNNMRTDANAQLLATSWSGDHTHAVAINASGGTNNIAAGMKLLFCIAY
ncbi:phage tail protein [Neisseria sp. Ec49-e6-T10]|uniref:phage tail protein n=1 Tax=Neisseria sp. Ec49-e6-T10 TaxID=3140744 RepID=UPI003EB8CB3F